MATSAVVPEQKLSEEGRAGLETLVKGCLKEELTARRSEVRQAWRQRSFANSQQYLWWDEVSNCYMHPSASGQEMPRYMDVYNIYTPHKRSFTSILSQNPPGVNFVPDDLQRSLDVTAAAREVPRSPYAVSTWKITTVRAEREGSVGGAWGRRLVTTRR